MPATPTNPASATPLRQGAGEGTETCVPHNSHMPQTTHTCHKPRAPARIHALEWLDALEWSRVRQDERACNNPSTITLPYMLSSTDTPVHTLIRNISKRAQHRKRHTDTRTTLHSTSRRTRFPRCTMLCSPVHLPRTAARSSRCGPCSCRCWSTSPWTSPAGARSPREAQGCR